MTEGRGEMRETYPVVGEAYRYRMEEHEDSFNLEMEEELPDGLPPIVSLIIQSRENGEGICRPSAGSGPSTGPGWAGRTHAFAWAWVGTELHLWLDGDLFVFQPPGPSTGASRRRGGGAAADASGDITAPMPGAVLEVLVSEGDRVERNQGVAIMESMKMELVITAPRDGVIRRISVQPGQQVERGMRLMELAPEGDAGE